MTVCRGDVVLIAFPNSDLATYKKRPALVVQFARTELEQTILVLITTTRREGPTRVFVAKDSPAAKSMGLLGDSVIVTDNIATVLNRQIIKPLGRCPIMHEVDKSLRRTLGLSSADDR